MDDNNVSNVIPDLEEFQVDFDEVVNVGGGTSDFNQLTNRPKYDGQTMTGNTNIPKVHEKTSDLNNDSDYQTGTEVQEAINDSISQINIPTKTSDLTNDGADGTSTYVEAADLATVATTGSYNDLSNKPSIPTVNDATLTINQNGVTKGTFTANDSDNEICDLTDTTYTAGTNVQISAQNEISAMDTTYSNFTGTDGTAAGASGLVPAPATTDAGKFLKANGTWDTAGGGGGVTPVQTTGTSTTDVMSQDATTHMVYSEANPSTSAQGGAIYLGNLDTNQVQQADPATANRGWKYFWALPSSNTSKPINNSVCILGDIPYQTTGVAIGSTVAFGCKVLGSGGVAIGPDAEATQQSVAIGFMANASRDNRNNGSVIAIGDAAEATANNSICIGGGGSSYGVQNSASTSSITLGYKAGISGYKNSVALGAYSSATRQGEVNVGLVKDETTGGYNNTAYRVIGGVHDGQLAQDAVTVSQVNATIDAINAALSTNIPHIGAAS